MQMIVDDIGIQVDGGVSETGAEMHINKFNLLWGDDKLRNGSNEGDISQGEELQLFFYIDNNNRHKIWCSN